MIGERAPPGGGVSDVPVPRGGLGEAARWSGTRAPSFRRAGRCSRSRRRGGRPGARARPGWRPGCGGRGWSGGGPAGWRRRPAGRACAVAGAGCWRGAGRARVVAVEDAVGVADDAGGGCRDAVPGGEDGGCGLGARVGAASLPGRQAGAGGDAVPGAGDVGDGVGFGLAHSRAGGGGGPGRVTAGCVVQQDVAELVRQCPVGLLAGQAGKEPDAAGGPEGGAVGWCAVFAFDGESFAAGQPAQRIPQAGRGWAGRGQPGRDGEGLAGGLRQVPDVADPVGIPPGRRRLVVVTLVAVLRSSRGGPGRDAEGLDALLRGGGPAVRPRSIAGSPGPWWRRAAGRR